MRAMIWRNISSVMLENRCVMHWGTVELVVHQGIVMHRSTHISIEGIMISVCMSKVIFEVISIDMSTVSVALVAESVLMVAMPDTMVKFVPVVTIIVALIVSIIRKMATESLGCVRESVGCLKHCAIIRATSMSLPVLVMVSIQIQMTAMMGIPGVVSWRIVMVWVWEWVCTD